MKPKSKKFLFQLLTICLLCLMAAMFTGCAGGPQVAGAQIGGGYDPATGAYTGTIGVTFAYPPDASTVAALTNAGATVAGDTVSVSGSTKGGVTYILPATYTPAMITAVKLASDAGAKFGPPPTTKGK